VREFVANISSVYIMTVQIAFFFQESKLFKYFAWNRLNSLPWEFGGWGDITQTDWKGQR